MSVENVPKPLKVVPFVDHYTHVNTQFTKGPSETVPTNQTQVGLINTLVIISTLAWIRFLFWLDKSTGATV